MKIKLNKQLSEKSAFIKKNFKSLLLNLSAGKRKKWRKKKEKEEI